MKVRNDFVTNSSSSSFILSFKDEESIRDTLTKQFPDNIKDGWSAGEEGYLEQLLNEIKDVKRYTKDDVALILKEEYKYGWVFRDELRKQGMSYSEAYDFFRTPEGKRALDAWIDEEIEDVLKSIGDDQVIVEVEHGDGGDGEDGVLENEILPSLDCTVISFSHH